MYFLINKTLVIHSLDPKNLIIDENKSEETASLASMLGLKSHTVQVSDDRRVRIFLSATSEIHVTENKHYYLTCLSDICPIDYNTMQNSIKRLRPEFLNSYPTPLCSDALVAASGGSKREIETNNLELIKACRYLKENHIPTFISSLDNLKYVLPYDSQTFTTLLHNNGISMRYLGL